MSEIDWCSDPGGDDDESVPVIFCEDFESDCWGDDDGDRE